MNTSPHTATATTTAPSAVRRDAASQMTTGAPVVRLAPRPRARLRLVCFPHSGAGPGVFHRWTRSLAPDVEVWSAVLPGRAARADEPFADRWESVVAEAADAIDAAVPGPYALFGQSLGAVLAFETACELQRRRRPPAHLIVSASAAPDAREVFPVPTDDEALIRTVDRYYGGIPAEVRAVPELVAYFLPALRADLELAVAYAYRSGPPLGFPVTAFAGDRDPSVSAAGLAAWHGRTAAGCEIHRLAGGHFCLDDDEDRALAVVRRRLAGAR